MDQQVAAINTRATDLYDESNPDLTHQPQNTYDKLPRNTDFEPLKSQSPKINNKESNREYEPTTKSMAILSIQRDVMNLKEELNRKQELMYKQIEELKQKTSNSYKETTTQTEPLKIDTHSDEEDTIDPPIQTQSPNLKTVKQSRSRSAASKRTKRKQLIKKRTRSADNREKREFNEEHDTLSKRIFRPEPIDTKNSDDEEFTVEEVEEEDGNQSLQRPSASSQNLKVIIFLVVNPIFCRVLK